MKGFKIKPELIEPLMFIPFLLIIIGIVIYDQWKFNSRIHKYQLVEELSVKGMGYFDGGIEVRDTVYYSGIKVVVIK